jgi:hypothetical protein
MIGSLGGRLAPIALDGHERPDRLDDPKGPGPGQEPVRARERTPAREGEHETPVAALERVHHHHEGHRAGAEYGQHTWMIAHPVATQRS